jgi:hypothetical protein
MIRSQPRVEHLGVVLELEEAEHPPPVPVELVERPVDLGGDPAHHALSPASQEVLRLAVLEVGIQLAAEEQVALEPEGRHPRCPGVQPERQCDERPQLAWPADGPDFDWHPRQCSTAALGGRPRYRG